MQMRTHRGTGVGVTDIVTLRYCDGLLLEEREGERGVGGGEEEDRETHRFAPTLGLREGLAETETDLSDRSMCMLQKAHVPSMHI